MRESSGSVTLNGRAYELLLLYYTPGTTGLDMEVRRTPLVLSDFTGLSLRIGTTTLAIADATANTFGGTRRHWAWTGAPSGLIANGNFDAHLLRVVALGAWHGVTTNGAGRVTALDLSGNGCLRRPGRRGVTAWLDGIRTAGGTATVDVCAASPPPSPSRACAGDRDPVRPRHAGRGHGGRRAGWGRGSEPPGRRYTSRAAWWPEWMAISSQRGASASPTTRTSPS